MPSRGFCRFPFNSTVYITLRDLFCFTQVTFKHLRSPVQWTHRCLAPDVLALICASTSLHYLFLWWFISSDSGRRCWRLNILLILKSEQVQFPVPAANKQSQAPASFINENLITFSRPLFMEARKYETAIALTNLASRSHCVTEVKQQPEGRSLGLNIQHSAEPQQLGHLLPASHC